MRALFILGLCVTAVLAAPGGSGTETSIQQYPFAAALLTSAGLGAHGVFLQACAGAVLTRDAVLAAAHCLAEAPLPELWRVRVGSTWANSGGAVHAVQYMTLHQSYHATTMDHDVAIVRTSTPFTYVAGAVAPAPVAGVDYEFDDYAPVYAIGWGDSHFEGSSEQLQATEVWTMNQHSCALQYAALGLAVSDNMVCAGWRSRAQCRRYAGGPLVHDNVVVGLGSWGHDCAAATYPSVSVRLSRYNAWIAAAAA